MADETTPLVTAGGPRRHQHRQNPSLTVVEVDLTPDDANNLMLDNATSTNLEGLAKQQRLPAAAASGAEHQDHPFTLLLRHDSEFSVGSDYHTAASSIHTDSPPLLNYWQGAILLTADCLGTGLLALPGDVHVLGFALGLGFLILNAPINLFAGTILAHAATAVERRQAAANRIFATALKASTATPHNTVGSSYQQGTAPQQDTVKSLLSVITLEGALQDDGAAATGTPRPAHQQLHHDTATFDFIGMTQALFKNPLATRLVMILYYCNIFLVLGNYILVMSHAVMATIGEHVLCTPVAGLIASTFMYVVSQSRTMARLGRLASILSLAALVVVICQCLYAAQTEQSLPGPQERPRFLLQTDDPASSLEEDNSGDSNPDFYATAHSVLRKLSALGSIGFAMGSQKLFLNIRHELQDRSQAPLTLGLSLTIFTSVYTLIIVLAGTNPPGFLFDAIPRGGWNRRIAGLLLWGHVVVSYAINSQAICSSMDRLFWHRFLMARGAAILQTPVIRWMLLTAIMAVAAYTVANAIPFFPDLVGLIGAMTAVPLTLSLPAIFWRKHLHVPLWRPTSWNNLASYALLFYSVLFMVVATVGVMDSILQDWKTRGGRPFECSTEL